MPTTPDNEAFRAGVRRMHDALAAPPDADIHQSPGGNGLFVDAKPGTAEHARRHLVGSAAPERFIERIDGVGPEGLGVVEVIDGRTGKSLRVLKNPRVGLDRD